MGLPWGFQISFLGFQEHLGYFIRVPAGFAGVLGYFFFEFQDASGSSIRWHTSFHKVLDAPERVNIRFYWASVSGC